jgi:aspartyl protease family protein
MAYNPHQRIGRGMAWLASLAVLGMLTLYFNGQVEQRDNPNRALIVAPGAELSLKRSANGHYIFPGTINGHPITFLLDTGATYVSIPAHLADTLGLERGMQEQTITANGIGIAYATRIDELAFGPFTLRNLPANLNPGMGDDFILLGMNVLKQLEFTQRGDTLVLRPLVVEAR